MGKRKTSSTKGGRFMNPTDQQRKLERRKELKRNKAQRLQVRSMVLKSKDCEELIGNMRKLDDQEFSLQRTSHLPPRVIQEKRNKMRETYLRVLGMYKKEGETEKLREAQRILHAYDSERAALLQNFMAEKFARDSNPADIPLPGGFAMPGSEMTPHMPAMPPMPLPPGQFPAHMLLPEPASNNAALPSTAPGAGILKKGGGGGGWNQQPPGPPPGLPPPLSDSDSDEDSGVSGDEEEAEAGEGSSMPSNPRKGVRFAEGDEEDEEEKDSRSRYKALAKAMAEEERRAEEEGFQPAEIDFADPSSFVTGVAAPLRTYGVPIAAGAAAADFAGSQAPRIPPAIGGGGGGPGGPRWRAPPPPPPGLPPRLMAQAQLRPPHPPANAVISAEPTVSKKPTGPVIEAKPQLRNMQKEVVKLIPTALRVRREVKPGTSLLRREAAPAPAPASRAHFAMPHGPAPQRQKPKGKDDAYEQFMKEMSGLM